MEQCRTLSSALSWERLPPTHVTMATGCQGMRIVHVVQTVMEWSCGVGLRPPVLVSITL